VINKVLIFYVASTKGSRLFIERHPKSWGSGKYRENLEAGLCSEKDSMAERIPGENSS
jgi:hypothetical protein